MISPDGRRITVWRAVPGRAVTAFLDTDTLQATGAEFINKHVSIRPRFVSSDVLAVFGCGRLEVITTQGRKLFTTAIPDQDRWVAPASRNGRRFALVGTYESAAHWSKPCFERVKVLD